MTLLDMRSISKTFGPVKALSNVSLQVAAGEVHALMGENGAGKSTLMKILSGAYVADRGGEVLIGGKKVETGDPKVAKANGIAVIYQELALSPNLTVAENIFLGAEPHRGPFIDRREMNRRSRQILTERLGLDFHPAITLGRLSLGERQMVEIARALSTNARLIVMDEPTTALTTRETEKLFDVIAQLKADGIAIIYISHRMEEVYTLADRCTVLRDGELVGTLEKREITAERVVSMMVGRDISTFYKKDHATAVEPGAVVLKVEGLGDGHFVHDCSFEVRHGEVIGIAGLVGSGRTELARLIYGAEKPAAGRVVLDGATLTIASPRHALAHGIAYLTEDRKGLGLFLDMSISENVNIGVLQRDAGTGGLLDSGAAGRRASKAMKSLAIRAPSAKLNTNALSGGNQQKVLLARLLELGPRVVILDEPTRGVDVGAKSEIYRLIDSLARDGIAVIVISSELPEIIGVSDRVLVMREGTIAGEVAPPRGEPILQEEIMAYSTGALGAERRTQGATA
ncbi:sugar ABC transporter ATP-binding protein [Acuticoccus sp. I52.16.1]|uniref:sugar ABC transporter ATP-binding protein n=1 Tax=Acuticoccus sp. I52.16.1 TaxID=2928472 RepID=UPI001FD1A23D|nr:sugar ABC transporter ATP-binding protein [Acuticoccus sp. I52.16.1]UOM36231.1 sugar ABC transporter ATP-binding protein [Acuticoccus sp. I52.16.1]